VTSLLVALALAASPKLALPSFTGGRPELASFCSERLADNLGAAGFTVVSEKQMAALLGLERQRQLLGCANDSTECLAELSSALGADAVVTGSIVQLGSRLQLDVRLISARSGERLGVVNAEAENEEAVPAVLAKLARELEGHVRRAFPKAQPQRGRPGLGTWVPVGAGVVSAVVGAVLLGMASSAHEKLVGSSTLMRPFTYAEGQSLASQEATLAPVGIGLLGVAAVAVVAGVLVWLLGGGT